MPRLARFVLLLVMFVPAIFMVAGYRSLIRQHQRIAPFVPVEARVHSRSISEHVSHGRRGRTVRYRPIVSYSFHAAGQEYASDQVLPIPETGGRAWAEAIVAPYPPGSSCQAWYNPADPADSFLVRAYSFGPYLFALLGAGFGGVLLGVVLLAPGPAQTRPPQRLEKDGWNRLAPAVTIGRRLAAWAILAAFWAIVGATTLGHWTAVVPWPWQMLPTAILIACAVAGLLIAWALLRSLALWRTLGDAEVLVDALPLYRGEACVIRIRQPFRRDARLRQMTIGLLCERTTRAGISRSTSVDWAAEEWIPLEEERLVNAGEALDYEHELVPPDDAPPTSPPGERGYPRHAWKFSLITRLHRGPTYKAQFPVQVQLRPEQSLSEEACDDATA